MEFVELEANGTGSAEMYWQNEVAEYQGQGETFRMVSQGWDERTDPDGHLVTHHERWFTLQASKSNAIVFLPRSNPQRGVMIYAKRIDVESASDLSVNAARVKQGELPRGAAVRDNAVWISGRFGFDVTATETSNGPGFTTRILGQPQQISVGGGPIISWPSNVTARIAVWSLAAAAIAVLADFLKGLARGGQSMVWHVLSARMTMERAASAPRRKQLLEMITTDLPFARLSEVARQGAQRLGISRLAVYYHVRLLHRFGLLDVVSGRHGSEVFVGPNHGFAPTLARKQMMTLASSPIRMAVIEAVVSIPDQNQATVIRRAQRILQERTGRQVSRIAFFKQLGLLSERASAPAASRILGNENTGRAGDHEAAIIRNGGVGARPIYRATPELAQFFAAVRGGANDVREWLAHP
jgi:hypothetical protein